MDWQELALTAARGVVVYITMLIVIRLLGKRTVGNFSAFDLLVALMLGEIVDETIYGDVSMAQGLTAIFVIALCKYVTAWLTSRNDTLNRILEGTPTELVRHGEFVREGLRAEVLHELEVLAALRLHQVADMREVKSALMEVDGQVSVIREDWAEPLTKSDLRGKDAEPVPRDAKRTDTPEALGERR
jgi:uncharacterized membrane protein YcaP (DUF421 family)